jgi:hypothetical protein
MGPHPAAALVQRRWDLLAAYKDDYWRSRKHLGLREALRVVGSLRAQARFFQPGWPTQDDREEDLETHIRVAEALARVGRNQAKRTGASQVSRPAPPRATRRHRRVR